MCVDLQILSCLADLEKLPAQPLLLTVTGRLSVTPQLRPKRAGGSILTMKLDDDSLQGGASFEMIAVSYLHETDRRVPLPGMQLIFIDLMERYL